MSKKAILSLELATRMYLGTDEQMRSFALENYPELSKKITERIRTFEDACRSLNISSELPFDFDRGDLSEIDVKAMTAFYKVGVIAKALNEGWIPDWSNSSEYKYYPWMKYTSGSGFSDCDYDYDLSHTVVGSRLCFKTEELARYVAKQFPELYNDLFTI